MHQPALSGTYSDGRHVATKPTSTADPCDDGQSCLEGADCSSLVCTGGCQSQNNDGILNGNETDIDCGGQDAAPCCGLNCDLGTDCLSAICTDNQCQVPANNDGVQNGDESDVDCGGTSGSLCNDGQSCLQTVGRMHR